MTEDMKNNFDKEFFNGSFSLKQRGEFKTQIKTREYTRTGKHGLVYSSQQGLLVEDEDFHCLVSDQVSAWIFCVYHRDVDAASQP